MATQRMQVEKPNQKDRIAFFKAGLWQLGF